MASSSAAGTEGGSEDSAKNFSRKKLLSMTFKQLKEHAKSLGIEAKFGMNRGGLIRAITEAFPPPPEEEDALPAALGQYSSAVDSMSDSMPGKSASRPYQAPPTIVRPIGSIAGAIASTLPGSKQAKQKDAAKIGRIMRQVSASDVAAEECASGVDPAKEALLNKVRPSADALRAQFERITGMKYSEWLQKKMDEDDERAEQWIVPLLKPKTLVKEIKRHLRDGQDGFNFTQAFRQIRSLPLDLLFNALITFTDRTETLDSTFLQHSLSLPLTNSLDYRKYRGLAHAETLIPAIQHRLRHWPVCVGRSFSTIDDDADEKIELVSESDERKELDDSSSALRTSVAYRGTITPDLESWSSVSSQHQRIIAFWSIPDVYVRMGLFSAAMKLFQEVRMVSGFIDTFHQAVLDVMKPDNESCQKLLLATIILNQFRGQDLQLFQRSRIRNLEHFLELIAVEITPSEEYISKKWDTIGTDLDSKSKKKRKNKRRSSVDDDWDHDDENDEDSSDDGELRDGETEWDRERRLRQKHQRQKLKAGMRFAQAVDLSVIRKKAIKYGSAVGVDDKTITSSASIQKQLVKERKEKITTEIGTIDTKARAALLGSSLFGGMKKPTTKKSSMDSGITGLDEDDKDPLVDSSEADKSSAVVMTEEDSKEDYDSKQPLLKSTDEVDWDKYRSMARARVPQRAILRKMKMDGVSEDNCQTFAAELDASGTVDHAYPESAASSSSSSSSSSSTPAPAPPGLSIAEIKARGSKLPMPPPTRSLASVVTGSSSASSSAAPLTSAIRGPPSIPRIPVRPVGVIPAPIPSRAASSDDGGGSSSKGKSDESGTVVGKGRKMPRILGKRMKKHRNRGVSWENAQTLVNQMKGSVTSIQRRMQDLKTSVTRKFEMAEQGPPKRKGAEEMDNDEDESEAAFKARMDEYERAVQYISLFLREDAMDLDGLANILEVVQQLLVSFEDKSEQCRRMIFDELVGELYYSKYRVQFVSKFAANESRFSALIQAMESQRLTATGVRMNEDDDDDDCEGAAPMEVVSIIWAYVKPFDEVLELKYAVTQINEYYDARKKKIDKKKVLRGQSHRGYDAEALYLPIYRGQ